MSHVIDFLRRRFVDTGFNNLAPEEVSAIQDFMLLWSAFEAELLDSNASGPGLVELGRAIGSGGALQLDAISPEIEYFRNRYWYNGALTVIGEDLGLDRYKPKDRQLAYDFLNASQADAGEALAGLLLIIYRLRNNLFHGPKWAFGIRGQLENFTKSNSVLIRVLST